MQLKASRRAVLRRMALLPAAFTACAALSGCLVSGFSSGNSDGSLVLPGGIGLLVLLGLLLWLLLRQR